MDSRLLATKNIYIYPVNYRTDFNTVTASYATGNTESTWFCLAVIQGKKYDSCQVHKFAMTQDWMGRCGSIEGEKSCCSAKAVGFSKSTFVSLSRLMEERWELEWVNHSAKLLFIPNHTCLSINTFTISLAPGIKQVKAWDYGNLNLGEKWFVVEYPSFLLTHPEPESQVRIFTYLFM